MIERFDLLLEQAQEAYASGQLELADETFARAEDLAREAGDVDRADLAYCRRCFVLVDLDRVTSEVPRLKELFLRSSHRHNRWSAAYILAVAYDVEGARDDAGLWAVRAVDLASSLGDPQLTLRCNNLAGVLALRRARFEDAEGAFREVLAAADSAELQPENAAQAFENLGYTLMCTERLAEGLELCERARGELERLQADHLLYETLQDLCYGYILDDRLDQAQHCGERAIDLAMRFGDELIVKNCLFLLSEIAVRRGDTFRARRYLRELTAYYPEIGVGEEIIDVFLQTDLTTVVNLRG